MRWLGGWVAVLVLGAACAPMKPVQAPDVTPPADAQAEAGQAPDETEWLEVRDVRVEEVAGGRRVIISLTRPPESVLDFTTTAPPRLILDLGGPRLRGPMPVTRFPLADPLVSQVRVGSHDGTLRAVVDLSKDPGTHTVRQEDTRVIVDLGDTLVSEAPAAADAQGAAPTGEGPPAEGPSAAPALVAAPEEPPSDAGSPAPPVAAAEASPPTEAAPVSPWLAVDDVRIEPVGSARRLALSLTRPPDAVSDFVLPNPPRLVMDLTGPGVTKPREFAVDDGVVSRVRVASHEGRLRVVADLRATPDAYAVRSQGMTVVADLGGDAVAAAPGAPPAPPATAVAEAAPAWEPPAPERDPTPQATAATDDDGEETPVSDPELAASPAPPPPPPRVEEPPVARPAAAEPREDHARPTAVDDPPPAPRPEPAGSRARRRTSAAPPRTRSKPVPAQQHFTGQRISLDFKDAEIQNVLRVLADVSRLNIIATDDVKGRVTLHLSDVPWDQALDLVLRSNRLEMIREGNVVRISTVGRLKEEREALRAAEDAERQLEPLQVSYVKVNYARADEALVEKVQGVLTDRGGVTFDERTNTIIVRDISRGVADAEDLIEELDVQSPQVLIESNLVEATEDFARALGVQWGYSYAAGPLTGNPTGANFPGTVGLGGSGLGGGLVPPASPGVPPSVAPFLADFPVPENFGPGFGPGSGSALNLALGSIDGSQSLTARLTALEEEGKGKVISRPRVITMNNVAATIQSLTIIRVKLPSTGTVINTGAGGAAGSASQATEKINTGITLVVTPQVSSDGFVLMNIFAKSSVPDFSRTVEGIPTEIAREANSNVLIRNGETVVLGGIYRSLSDDRESGVPYLRNVPALGWLFKRLLQTQRREELLVFITPRIVSAGGEPLPAAQRLWEQRQGG